MARATVLVFLSALMVLNSPVRAEDIYRWRDSNGILHFSDVPPPDTAAEVIPSPPPAKPSLPAVPTPADRADVLLQGGVFWQIDNGRSAPSFLLGTIHSADPRVLQWPPAIDTALQEAESFIMEMELKADSFFTLGSSMMFTDDRDLAELLGPADFRRLRDALTAQPIPETILRKMKPWVVLAILSQPTSGKGEFMDLRLYRQALSMGKAVFGLESAEEQLAVFDGMTIDDQVSLLQSTLDHLEDLPRMYDQMVDTYLGGDLAAIADLAQSLLLQNGTDLERRFLLRLNDERNMRMVERLLPHLDEGGVFIAVGALHLAGPSGLVHQLKDRGYRLSPVE